MNNLNFNADRPKFLGARLAIVAALAGCANQMKKPAKSPSVQVPEPVSVTLNAKEKEAPEPENYFTPQAALRAASGEPLRYVAGYEVWNRMQNRYDCLWGNSEVFMISENCPMQPATERQALPDGWATFYFFSEGGERIVITLEVPDVFSIYSASKSDYDRFIVEYNKVPCSFATPKTPKEYQEMNDCFYDNYDESEFYSCGMRDGKPIQIERNLDRSHSPLKRSMEKFCREPDSEWYDFLKGIRSLYERMIP